MTFFTSMTSYTFCCIPGGLGKGDYAMLYCSLTATTPFERQLWLHIMATVPWFMHSYTSRACCLIALNETASNLQPGTFERHTSGDSARVTSRFSSFPFPGKEDAIEEREGPVLDG